MNYTDAELNGFAAVAWAADAELRAQQGDPAPSLPGDPGEADAHEVTLARVRAVLGGATPAELHEAWVRDREAQGWTFGRADTRAKTDPALVPHAQLPEAQRVRDRVLTAILREVAGKDGAQPVPVSPDLECTVCASGVTSPHGVSAAPGQATRDHAAEEATREFTGWAEAQGYDDSELYSFAEMDEAFAAGMQAARDLDAAALAEVAAERDGLRNALRAIELGISEPSPKSVAENALNGRYFDPMNDSGVWRIEPALKVVPAAAPAPEQGGDL